MSAMAPFAKEADLVAAFCSHLHRDKNNPWQCYHETAGFDLLLSHKDTGLQVGLEAKLSLNVKVLSQALPSYSREREGPDYRGVLVPFGKVQNDLSDIASRLGIKVLQVSDGPGWQFYDLPNEEYAHESGDWFPWLPVASCRLPDYVPDVEGGKPSPIQLTNWKVRAIKLLILLERQGFVTRKDMKALSLSPTAWTQYGGYLAPSSAGYVRCAKTPDFRAQHPRNWSEIEADFDKWASEIQPAQTPIVLA